MKIVVISAAFPPQASGEAANALFLCQHLLDRGHDIHLITGDDPAPESLAGLTVHPIMTRWNWLEMTRLIRKIIALRPDASLLIMLGACYRYHPMITYLPWVLKLFASRHRFVTRFENPLSGADPWRYGLISRLIERTFRKLTRTGSKAATSGALLTASDHIIVLCEYHLELLRRQNRSVADKTVIAAPPPNIQVVSDPDGTLAQRGRRDLEVERDQLLIGYLGYLYPNKGFETLLEAVAELKRQNVRARLVVLGGRVDMPGFDDSGYYDRMLELAHRLKIDSQICWLGNFRGIDQKLASYIHAADVFVLPFDNGLHLNNSSFTSVAAYLKPIIGTFGDHQDHSLLDNANVLLFPPKNSTALVDKLKLIQNGSILPTLRSGIRNLVADELSWQSMIDKTQTALEGKNPMMSTAQTRSSSAG